MSSHNRKSENSIGLYEQDKDKGDTKKPVGNQTNAICVKTETIQWNTVVA